MHMISREEVRSSILKPLHRIFPPSVYASSPHSPKEKKNSIHVFMKQLLNIPQLSIFLFQLNRKPTYICFALPS